MKTISLFAALIAGGALAATTSTVTPATWDGYLGTTIKTRGAPSEAACVKSLEALKVTAKYTCRTRTGVSVVVTIDPPPPPPATCDAATKPADELRAVACPGSTTKWWNQSHTSTCVGTTWTATPWTPSAPSATECLPDAPPPPADPDIVYANPPNANAAALKPGQTMLLRDGVYNAFALPKCTAAAWCSIAAEHYGAVTITGLNVPWGSYFVSIEGVKYKSSSTKVITADHLAFKGVAFEGGPATGNDVSLQIGSNDRTPGASNILIQDSWVYGPGGRYKVLVYNSTGVALRRVVARHDGGWTYDGRNPQGGFSLYDSANVVCENCLFVDSVQNLSGFEAAIYLVSNGTTSTHQSNVSVAGSIVIDSPNNGLAAEGQSAATYSVTDLLVSGSKAGGVNTNGAGHTLNVIGLTANVSGAAIAKWSSSGSLRVTNCKIVKGSTTGATLTTCPGGAGAVVEKRIGSDSAFFGDADYAVVTKESLWPWPNEARIKADFDSVRPAFGGKSLTEYVKAATP